jgi:hypothetical protein
MSDNSSGPQRPAETRGVNVNFYPIGDTWCVELTPNPRSVAEAMRPVWRAVFDAHPFLPDEVFTLAQLLSALSIRLEDIAAERVEPVAATW